MQARFFILFFLLLCPHFANAQEGINSMPGSDLPIGAGGQRVITVTGGQTTGISKGNVGIGTQTPKAKLDVAGEIRSGNTNLACSAATIGSMRYNSGTNNMEFCNGSAWTQLGGTSAPSGTLCGFISCFSGLRSGKCGTVIPCMGIDINNNGCPSGYTLKSLFGFSASAGDGSYSYSTCYKN